jgi:adenylate kinase family enzyme
MGIFCYTIFMTPQPILLFGRAGSGKGTQAQLLMEYLKTHDAERKCLYLETGQKLRDFIVQDNHSAQLTKEVIKTGGLMPPFMPIWLWTSFLVENFTGDEHLVFDGLCRRRYESPILDTALQFYKRESVVVIIINTSNEWSMERALERGRSDDDLSEIKKRLEWFDTEVVSAIQYFRDNPKYTILDINGEQTIEEVNKEIMEKLNLRINE